MSQKQTDPQALQKAMQASAPDQIDLAFAGLFDGTPTDRWLPATNGVMGPKGPGDLPKSADAHTYASPILEDVLGYGAASVVLHCGDGWSYFSRGLAAFASGSLEVAQHLLYYAELRAARSVLHRHGVFVFDNNSFYVTQSGETSPLNGFLARTSTHQATWDVFDAWISVVAPSFLGDQLRLSGRSLSDWADSSASPVMVRAVIADLLRQWGVDLTLFLGDRTLRNQLSYDPNRLVRAPLGHSPAMIAACFQDAWSMLEPSGATSFDTFDSYLIREIFEHEFTSRRPDKTLESPEFEGEIDQMVSAVLGGASPSLTSKFYGNDKAPTPAMLKNASTDPSDASINLAERVVGMLGRSMVLLRLATASAADLITKSGVDKAEVGSWAEDLLEARGVRPPEGTPPIYEELFLDVAIDLEAMDLLHSLVKTSDMRDMVAVDRQTANLSIFERVPVWAVA